MQNIAAPQRQPLITAAPQQCDLSCGYFFQLQLSYQSNFSVSVFPIFSVSVIVIRIRFCPLIEWILSVTISLIHTVATLFVIVSTMQKNSTSQKLKILWRTSTSCTRRLVIQCRQRLYNEKWDNIYSVSVVNFYDSVSFSFSPFFCISVIIIVNRIQFYPLTEWIRFRYRQLKSHCTTAD